MNGSSGDDGAVGEDHPDSLSADDIANLAEAVKTANSAIKNLQMNFTAADGLKSMEESREHLEESARTLRQISRTQEYPELVRELHEAANALESASTAERMVETTDVSSELADVAETIQRLDVPVYLDEEGGLHPRLARLQKSGGSTGK